MSIVNLDVTRVLLFLVVFSGCEASTGNRQVAMPCETGSRKQGMERRLNPRESQVLQNFLHRSETMTVTVSIELTPTSPRQVSQKLRSIVLAVPPMDVEPAGKWPDGAPVSSHVRLSRPEAESILNVLARRGFLATSEVYHSPRNDRPTRPPPKGSRGLVSDAFNTDRITDAVRVQVSIYDEDWYTYLVQWNDLDVSLMGLLDQLGQSVSGDARKAVEVFAQQLGDSGG